ncbi:MAG TPA: DUF2723 domain-containing protein [Chitinispirillaceae bacterium]|nr:DUF2723 domain-containing protein [Chitinispirillaceae bacterium]
MEQIHSRYNRIFALGVFLISFVIFVMTMAPTVAFWDCGEYISAGHTMGVPHPPGNPLFMIMLRVSSILFSFFKDVGYRMNFLVVLFSAGTAAMIYLTVVRVVISFLGIPDNSWKRITTYVGGVVGGLFAVSGTTFWFSAVEASEANPSMFVVALCTWLIMVWSQSKDPKRDKLLLLLVYASFLGIGIHMYSMIVLIPVFLFIMLTDKEKLLDWRLWLTTIAVGIAVKDLNLFMWTGGAAVVVTAVMALMEGANQKKWRFCFWIATLAVVGFSSHLYIPIRSSLNPIIDENDPQTVTAFNDYLARKQYGSEDMISRMFWRRASWGHQFGIEGHMGYGGFHMTQFFQFKPTDNQENFVVTESAGFAKLIVYLLPTFFMLFGWYHVYKRNRNVGLFLITLFIMTSVVMVLYINFSDGTRPELRDYQYWVNNGKPGPMPVVHREVRVRDYFFAAAFMYLGMWMGIAASALMHVLFTSKNKAIRTTLAPIAAVLLFVSPALPITQNWEKSSRKGDWVPYDYAYNLLMSCEENGIIFTNGDNDTFPLWALQEAYGIRKDVRIVNLSLLNTKWYIKQLRDLEPKVPITWSDAEIDALDHVLNPITKPTQITMPNAKIVIMPPTRKELNALRIQDNMVAHIVDANKWKKPIYFAVTVSDDNLMGLGPYLSMQGLAYRVMSNVIEEKDRLDIARTVHLLDNVFKFRGLGDGTARLNDTSEKLMSNYAASYIQLALSLRDPLLRMKQEIALLSSDTSKQQILIEKKKAYEDTLNLVVRQMDKCTSLMPDDWRPRILCHEILMLNDRQQDAEKRMREALKRTPDDVRYLKALAQSLEQQPQKKDEHVKLLKSIMALGADPWNDHLSLARAYIEMKQYDSASKVIEQFANAHPGDRRAASFIQQIRQLSDKTADTAMKVDTAKAVAN